MRSACAARSRVSVFANPESAARMNALQLTCLPLPQALTTHQAPEREASCAWYAGTSSGPCPWSGTAVAQGPTKSVRPVRDAGGFPSPGFHHRWPAARDRHRAEAPQLSRPPRSPSGRVPSSFARGPRRLRGFRSFPWRLRLGCPCGLPGFPFPSPQLALRRPARSFRTRFPHWHESGAVTFRSSSRFRNHWSHSMLACQTRCTGG